jgi:hypothetical protein
MNEMKISEIGHVGMFQNWTTWENGKTGSLHCFTVEGGNNVLYEIRFEECSHDFKKRNHSRFQEKEEYRKHCPMVATGFIAYWIIHCKESSTDIYDAYYTGLQQTYVKAESRKAGAHKRNLNNEFYRKHIIEEKERADLSQSLFEYLPEQEKQTIRSYIEDYFEYIQKKFIEQHPEIIKQPQLVQTLPVKENVGKSHQKSFTDYLIHSSPAALIEKLKPIFAGAKGKQVAIRLVAMRNAKLIAWADGERTHLYAAMRLEFGEIGSDAGINRYLYDMRSESFKDGNKEMITKRLTYAEVKPFIRQMKSIQL